MKMHDYKTILSLFPFLFLSLAHGFPVTPLQFLAPPKNTFPTQESYRFRISSGALEGRNFSNIEFSWADGPGNSVLVAISKGARSYENPTEVFQPFFEVSLSGSDDDTKYDESFTGLQLGDTPIQYGYSDGYDLFFKTLTEASKISMDRGARECTMGPDGELIDLPYDSSKDGGTCQFVYKNFYVRLFSFGPETNNRFAAFDSLLLQTKSRITIFRADEEASELLVGFQGPVGIRKSLEAKIESFKKACMDFNYNRALQMIEALRNELSAQRGKQVPETLFQALSKVADEFESSTRFLVNPVLPPPAANVTPAHTGGN